MRAPASMQIRVIYELRRHLSEKRSCMKLVMYGGVVVAPVERSENRGGERTSGLALGCGRHVCGKVIYDSGRRDQCETSLYESHAIYGTTSDIRRAISYMSMRAHAYSRVIYGERGHLCGAAPRAHGA
jgi:hypothetical protein